MSDESFDVGSFLTKEDAGTLSLEDIKILRRARIVINDILKYEYTSNIEDPIFVSFNTIEKKLGTKKVLSKLVRNTILEKYKESGWDVSIGKENMGMDEGFLFI